MFQTIEAEDEQPTPEVTAAVEEEDEEEDRPIINLGVTIEDITDSLSPLKAKLTALQRDANCCKKECSKKFTVDEIRNH